MKEKIEKYNLKVVEFLKELEYYGMSKRSNQIFIINGENKKKYESLTILRLEIQMMIFDLAELQAGTMWIQTIDNARHNAHVSWYLASLACTTTIVEFGETLDDIVKYHYIISLSPEVYKFKQTEFEFIKYHEIGHAINDHLLDLVTDDYDGEINLGNLKFPKNEIIADDFAFKHMSDKTGIVEKRVKFFVKQMQKASRKHLMCLDIISKYMYIPRNTFKTLKDIFYKSYKKNFNETVSRSKLELCDRVKFAEGIREQMEME